MKILIAEDEYNTAVPYKIALEMKNHEVVITNNGEGCLKLYRDALKIMPRQNGSPFDVVILDYRMPDKNGIEVAEEILSLNPHQKIIFASAYLKQFLTESMEKLKHAIVIMQKPFELDELVGRLEQTNHA